VSGLCPEVRRVRAGDFDFERSEKGLELEADRSSSFDMADWRCASFVETTDNSCSGRSSDTFPVGRYAVTLILIKNLTQARFDCSVSPTAHRVLDGDAGHWAVRVFVHDPSAES
jgi:hypothetical protein